MPIEQRRKFEIRPHGVHGAWESHDRRYFGYAKALLVELEELSDKVVNQWPVPQNEPLRDNEDEYPEIWKLAHLRNRTSDAVRIFAAMAVEGFLNWYGIFRLGEAVFNQHFERLGLVPKLRMLSLVCDGLEVTENDPLVRALDEIAKGRNALVHPKAREVQGHPAEHQPRSTKVPDVAREAVQDMERFYCEFVAAVPPAKAYVPTGA